MEKFDFKKEFKDLYSTKALPTIVDVPKMKYIMVDGMGNPNVEGGEYQKAVELLYTLSYSIKMSVKSGNEPNGYFDYVMPPLEGLWWMDNNTSFEQSQKEKYCWTSMICQPEFVTTDVFSWACEQVQKKKPLLDTSIARFQDFSEGLCVQILHKGSYDEEHSSISKIERYIKENNLLNDIGGARRHHEIYLSNPQKTKAESLRTILRHPVKRR